MRHHLSQAWLFERRDPTNLEWYTRPHKPKEERYNTNLIAFNALFNPFIRRQRSHAEQALTRER